MRVVARVVNYSNWADPWLHVEDAVRGWTATTRPGRQFLIDTTNTGWAPDLVTTSTVVRSASQAFAREFGNVGPSRQTIPPRPILGPVVIAGLIEARVEFVDSTTPAGEGLRVVGGHRRTPAGGAGWCLSPHVAPSTSR